MLTTAVIAVITFIILALSIFFPSLKIGKIRLGTYWIVAFIGAAVLLCTGLTPAAHILNELNSDSAVNPIKILTHLTVCLVFLVISGYINVPMWLVAAICAASLLFCALILRTVNKRERGYISHSLKRMPWQLIPFVLSMFVIVICLQYQAVGSNPATPTEKICR